MINQRPSLMSQAATSVIRGMVWIPAPANIDGKDGTFWMGSDDFYPEERPMHRAHVAGPGFWMDRYPVTNAEFSNFVEATDYVTVAERTPNANEYPGIDIS